MAVNSKPKVEVLDAIMGSGKSYGIVKWMNNNPNNRYLYISPMLTEVEERIPLACEGLGFVYPEASNEYKTKGSHLLHLLSVGGNVCFTHKLFEELTRSHLHWIKEWGYILIVDEEVDMVSQYGGRYTKEDIVSLEQAGHIKVHEDDLGRIEWLWNSMEEGSQYSQLRRMSNLGMIYCSKNRTMMVMQLPLELLAAAKRCIILTYLFEGSLMDLFLKMKGVEIAPFTEVIPRYKNKEIIERAKQNIEIRDTTHTKRWKRDSKWSMSYYWWDTRATPEQLKEVGNCIRSILRQEDNKNLPYMFTMPKISTEHTVSGRRNPKWALNRWIDTNNWLYASIRATNDFDDKRVLIHLYNRFINLTVKTYLADYGVEQPCDDRFAISELIQWVWRSNIRKDGGSITIYFGSKRMEDLFRKWLEQAS